MSLTEIIHKLPKLSAEEKYTLRERLSETDNQEEFIPTPEMLAAIDEGIRSAETEPLLSVEEVREKVHATIRQCARRSK